MDTTLSLGAVPAHYASTLGPDTVCLTYPDGALTWLELDMRTNQRARAFSDLGVGQDDFVTIALPNGSLFHETTFALWKLGATPHVVSSKLPDPELRAIADLLKPKLIVGVDQAVTPNHRVVPADLATASHASGSMPLRVAKHWKAMSSGGSTGQPKIIVDHNPAKVEPDEWFLDMPLRGCVLNPGPLYHNAPFIFSHYGLFRGNHVVGMSKFDALESLRLVEKYRPSWVMMVPTMMHRIWRLEEPERTQFDTSSLDIVAHVAAPMPAWLKEKWIEWLGPERVYELYGATEGTGATWISGTEWLAHKGSVGKFIRGARVKILGEDGRECAPREIGEVFLMPEGGPGSTYHYIGGEPRSVAGGWESVGDIGWLDDDGYLYLADRRTDLIISGGANIYPAEVESALAEHPAVDTAVVIGLPDDDLGQIVHAIIFAHEAWRDRITGEMLCEFVEQKLVRYKTPRTYEFVAESLRDDAGKVRRPQLRAERLAHLSA